MNKKSDISRKQVDELLNAYKKFFDDWIELSNTKNGFFIEDLKQNFILQILQRYKRQNLIDMVKTLNIGLIFMIAFFILAFSSYILESGWLANLISNL